MGKKRRDRVEYHKQSLGEQIEHPETYGVRTQPRAQKRHRHSGANSEDELEQEVPGALSNKILQVARDQQEELEEEDKEDAAALPGGARDALNAAMKGLKGAASDSDEEDFGDDFSDPGSAGWEEEWEEEVNVEDEAALAAFMNPAAKDQKQKTLSDVIMEKIREKQAEAGLAAVPRYVF